MEESDKLSDEEFKQMMNYLNRYASTDMDQWAMWRFNSDRGGYMHVTIQMGPDPDVSDDEYIDLSHLIESK